MLTVLIATYNGGRTLPSVLNAYCKLAPPDEEWKLVIVDNGSTDNTEEKLMAGRWGYALLRLASIRGMRN